MKLNEEFETLEQQLRATTEPVQPLSRSDINQIRPRFQATSFPWHKVAAPLGVCAAAVIAILAFLVIRNPSPTLTQETANVTPTVVATTGEAVELEDPTYTLVSEVDAAAYGMQLLQALDSDSRRTYELLSAELITAAHLALDQNNPDPTLPDQFWAVTMQRTTPGLTQDCTVLTEERYIEGQRRLISTSCNNTAEFEPFSDTFVQTSPPRLITYDDAQISESNADIRDINITPADRDGFSTVDVTIPYANRDRQLILHWSYFYQEVAHSNQEEANAGDIIIPLGPSRGIVTVQFEVSNKLINNGKATNLFLYASLTPAFSTILADKQIVYVVPDNLGEKEAAFSAESLAKVGINVRTVNSWLNAQLLLETVPIDVLLVHHSFVQFRPMPSHFVDGDTIRQLIDDGVVLVGVGVSIEGLRSGGQFNIKHFASQLHYSVFATSDALTLDKADSFILSTGWSQLRTDLESFFENADR